VARVAYRPSLVQDEEHTQAGAAITHLEPPGNTCADPMLSRTLLPRSARHCSDRTAPICGYC